MCGCLCLVYVCVCVCVFVCVRACVCACVRDCVRACVRLCVGVGNAIHHTRQFLFQSGDPSYMSGYVTEYYCTFCRFFLVFRWPAHQRCHRILQHLTHWIPYYKFVCMPLNIKSQDLCPFSVCVQTTSCGLCSWVGIQHFLHTAVHSISACL